MSADEERSFLARWSRRKRAALEDAPRAEAEPPAEDAEAADARDEQAPDAARDPVLELPSIESLGPGSDFRPFMAEGVPHELRRAALRKLWRTRSVLANLDGMVDYGGDYTKGGVAVGMLKTAYRVGRGFADHAADHAEEVERAASSQRREEGGGTASGVPASGAQETSDAEQPSGAGDRSREPAAATTPLAAASSEDRSEEHDPLP